MRRRLKKKLKFVWGSTSRHPDYRPPGKWLFDRTVVDPKIKGVVISVRCVLGWLAAMLVVAYVAGTQVWHAWERERPYCYITRMDALLLPLRVSRVREEMGRAMIAEGLDDLKARHWGEGQMKLRVGLARAPHSPRARLELARIYLLSGRRPEAIKLLTEDLAQGYPGRDYLDAYFHYAMEGEDYGGVISVCDRFLPVVPAADRAWLKLQKQRAQLGAGQNDAVLRETEAEGDRAGADTREARVLALSNLGRHDEALAYLEKWSRWPGANPIQIARLKAQELREAGRIEAMEAELARLRDLTPWIPEWNAYGIRQNVLAGRPKEAAALLDDYLFRFAGTPGNISLVARELGKAQDLPLVERCVREAQAHGFAMQPFLQVLLDAEVDAHQWAAAARTLARLGPLTTKSDLPNTLYLQWMQHLIAAVGRNEAQQAVLIQFLRNRPFSLGMFRRTCEVLLAAGQVDVAGRACAVGRGAFPASASLARLDARIQKLVATEKTAKPVVVAATAAAPGEKIFFKEIDSLAHEEKWGQAAEAIRKIRVARPRWLERREADVLEWDMRVALQADDLPELLGAARLFLNGTYDRSNRVLVLAETAHRAGAKEKAGLLLSEVLRRSPGYPPAVRLQSAWRPKASKPAQKS